MESLEIIVGEREIHYEVYLMRRAKGAWALYQAFDSRETAIETAKTLHENHPEGSVRVEKETYDGGSRDFDAVRVFQLGEATETVHASVRDDRTTEPPCALAEDLWTIHARSTIARVLDEWLRREGVTALELMHRADLAEKLESAGITVQHAIQKTAIAQAQQYDSSVQHFVKRLNELSEKAFNRVIEDGRQGRLPVIGAEGFAALAEKLKTASLYRRCALVANGLKGAQGAKVKIKTLLDMADQLTDPDIAEIMLPVLDDFLTELLVIEAAANTLAQDPEDLGDILDVLVDMITSTPQHPDNLSAEAVRLSAYFKARQFPGARATLARRVLDDLCRPVRLKPDDVWGEVKLSRSLADRLIALAGADFPPERTAEAFIYRSGRMVAPEVIEEALATADTSVDALDRLMRLETAIAGEPTKRKLAAYIRGRLGSHQTEGEFVRGPGKPMERLAQLTALQRKALNSGFCDEDRGEISDALDRMGMRVLEQSKLLAALEARDVPPLDRAASLLRLATNNLLPQGRCQTEASTRAQSLMREAMKSGQTDPARLTEIRDMLGELAA